MPGQGKCVAIGLGVIALGIVLTPLVEPRVVGDPRLFDLLVVGGLLLAVVGRRITRVRPRERVLVLGTGPVARKVVDTLHDRPDLRYEIVGAVDDGTPTSEPLRCTILGPLDELDRIMQTVRPDRVIVALAEQRGRLPVRRLLESRAHGIVAERGVDVYERLTGKLALESLTPSSLVFSDDFRKSRLRLAVGRVLGLLVSAVGLVGLAPLFGLIALAVKLDSAGPVFFVQDRVGMGGRAFRLIKFRTMHPAAGHTSEWERDNSDRITRVGSWLRRFRLDELPQLVNVLRGDMNLVGPRPHPFSNLHLFVLALRNLNDVSGEAIPYYSLRCAVRPGITGWAQVRYGYANDLDEETEKIRYDLYYVKHLSLWLDLRILSETVTTVLSGRGGAGVRAPGVEGEGRGAGAPLHEAASSA